MAVKRVSKLSTVVDKLQQLGEYEVRVGITSTTGRQPKSDGQGGFRSDVTLGQVAMWNEYGTVNSPARPAFRQAARGQRYKKAVNELLKNFMFGLTSRRTGEVVNLLKPSVQKMANATYDFVARYDAVPNAVATVAKKGLNDPLVDTGQLLEGIRGEIRKKRRKVWSTPGR